MGKLYYSPAALHDLDDIWNYISEELCNPNAALNTVNHIQDSLCRLREFPEMGPSLSPVVMI